MLQGCWWLAKMCAHAARQSARAVAGKVACGDSAAWSGGAVEWGKRSGVPMWRQLAALPTATEFGTWGGWTVFVGSSLCAALHHESYDLIVNCGDELGIETSKHKTCFLPLRNTNGSVGGTDCARAATVLAKRMRAETFTQAKAQGEPHRVLVYGTFGYSRAAAVGILVGAALARNFDSYDDWANRMYWKRPQARIAKSVESEVREALRVLSRQTIQAGALDAFSMPPEPVWNDADVEL